MQQKITYVKKSVSLPNELWDYVTSRTANGAPVPASRVIALAVEKLKAKDAKKTNN
jgi:hypothetical protein